MNVGCGLGWGEVVAGHAVKDDLVADGVFVSVDLELVFALGALLAGNGLAVGADHHVRLGGCLDDRGELAGGLDLALAGNKLATNNAGQELQECERSVEEISVGV